MKTDKINCQGSKCPNVVRVTRVLLPVLKKWESVSLTRTLLLKVSRTSCKLSRTVQSGRHTPTTRKTRQRQGRHANDKEDTRQRQGDTRQRQHYLYWQLGLYDRHTFRKLILDPLECAEHSSLAWKRKVKTNPAPVGARNMANDTRQRQHNYWQFYDYDSVP